MICLLCSALIAAATIISVSAVNTDSVAAGRLYGDVNNDGEINTSDATLIQKYIVELAHLDAESLRCVDVNQDGSVDVMDATCIQKYIVGLEHNSMTGQPM